jgi:hypothetical protein
VAQLGAGTQLGDRDGVRAFKLYQGAHNATFWREHQDEWLGAAVDRLEPPS